MSKAKAEVQSVPQKGIGLSIGEAAERLGVSVHTLRYYEDAGLLIGVGRRANGHRSYGEDDLHYLDLLRCLRLTGMPIAQMRIFANLIREGETTAADRLDMMTKHREEIERQRRLLDRAVVLVDEKIKRYRNMASVEVKIR